MKITKLDDMVKGWFVGAFEPTLINTNDVEVAVKEYKCGDSEGLHYHKIATEITVLVGGKVKINNIVYTKGDMVVIEPNEATDFESLEDTIRNTICTVVKYPGASNDKYLGKVK